MTNQVKFVSKQDVEFARCPVKGCGKITYIFDDRHRPQPCDRCVQSQTDRLKDRFQSVQG